MMRHARNRLWLFRLTGGIGLAAMVLLGYCLTASKLPQYRLNRAIHRFETAPTQAGADALMEHLSRGAPTLEQGERILRMLLEPKITTRRAYPAGQRAGISAERPFRLYSPYARIRLQEGIEGEQVSQDPRMRYGTNTLTTEPRIFTLRPSPGEPPTQLFHIYYDCELTHQRYHMSLWQRIRAGMLRRFKRSIPAVRPLPEKTYRCRFSVPVEINVAPGDAAERLELVCGREIDEKMRSIVTARIGTDSHGSYETPSGRRGYRGSTLIEIKTPPVDVAWQVSLRLADGRDLPEDPADQAQRIRLRAGSPDIRVVDMGCFGIEEPGEYSGTLVLRPDSDYAYEDPAIKSLWNGELEFPVSFVVYVKTNAR